MCGNVFLNLTGRHTRRRYETRNTLEEREGERKEKGRSFYSRPCPLTAGTKRVLVARTMRHAGRREWHDVKHNDSESGRGEGKRQQRYARRAANVRRAEDRVGVTCGTRSFCQAFEYDAIKSALAIDSFTSSWFRVLYSVAKRRRAEPPPPPVVVGWLRFVPRCVDTFPASLYIAGFGVLYTLIRYRRAAASESSFQWAR